MTDLADRMKSFLNAVHLAVQYQQERDEARATIARIETLVGPTGDGGAWFLHRSWNMDIIRVILVDDIREALRKPKK